MQDGTPVRNLPRNLAGMISSRPIFRVPGMALILEVRVLYGPIGRNRQLKATAPPRGGVGRKPKAKLGVDEQEPDRRPVRWGHPAMDGEARKPSGHAHW